MHVAVYNTPSVHQTFGPLNFWMIDIPVNILKFTLKLQMEAPSFW